MGIHFFLKKVIGKFGLRKFVSVPTKFGVKSPPMLDGDRMQGSFVA